MNNRIATAITGIAAALIMTLAVSTASANNLSISHATFFSINFAQLKFKAAGLTQLECDLTLEASFHSTTIAKTERVLLGYVRGVRLGICATGSAIVLTESLPWHLQYGGFNGSLPTPRLKVRLVGLALGINSILGSCLGMSSEANPLLFIAEPEYERGGNGLVRRVTVEAANQIPTSCGININAEGTGSVFEGRGAQTVLLRLI